jgi:hypothetical protein
MREVRLILALNSYDYDNDDRAVLKEGVVDWEKISEEDYQFLRANLYLLETQLASSIGGSLILVEKDPVPVRERISSIKAWIAAQQEKIKLEEAAKKAKAEERARKKLLKNASSELQLLEELRKKYPDA